MSTTESHAARCRSPGNTTPCKVCVYHNAKIIGVVLEEIMVDNARDLNQVSYESLEADDRSARGNAELSAQLFGGVRQVRSILTQIVGAGRQCTERSGGFRIQRLARRILLFDEFDSLRTLSALIALLSRWCTHSMNKS